MKGYVIKLEENLYFGPVNTFWLRMGLLEAKKAKTEKEAYTFWGTKLAKEVLDILKTQYPSAELIKTRD